MKRILSFTVAVCMIFACAANLPENSSFEKTSIIASAEVMKDGTEGKCGKNISWTLVDGVLSLNGSGDMYDYKSADDSPFATRKDINKIIISNGITSVGKNAFYECHALTSVSLPEGITKINDCAFYWCNKLGNVKIPSTVEIIGSYSFYMTYAFTSVSLPKGLTTIADHAFAYSSIKSVDLPDTLTRIGENAFSYSDIKSVTIPPSVKAVGNAAFWNCTKLESLTVKSGVLRITTGAFNGCSKLSSVKLPDTLTVIGQGAFSSCRSLKSISISKNVNTVGARAFEGSGLTSIKLSDNVTWIGEEAFKNCSSLKSAVLSKDLEDINDGVFYNCQSLESVNIPLKLRTIGREAFYQCKALKLIYLPDTLKSIGDMAFALCNKIKSLNIPKGVKVLPQSLFSGCIGLESITLSNGLTEIGDAAFEGCQFLSTINLPSTVSKIGSNAFYSCSSLKSITIPDKVTNIPNNAFSSCSGLKSVRLPKNLKTIGSFAFYNCTKLTSIVIPKLVTKIDGSALGFYYDAGTGFNKQSSFTVKCFKGSAAEKYAKEYEINYALITFVNAKDPTCSAAGNTAHWICQNKYYNDEMLTNPTTKDKVTIKALGHKFSDWKTTSFNVDKKTSVQTRKCTRGDKTETKTVKNAIVRYAGSDRAETATLIANALKGGNTKTSDTVIIATGFDFHDALAAVPLASAYNAPLLLADRDNLSAKTLAKIKTLKPKNIIVVATSTAKDANGNKAAIGSNVYKQLSGYKVTKLTGSSYYETAKKVAAQMQIKTKKAPTSVFITTDKNYADALSASPVAAILKAPIIFVKPTGALDSNTKNYLSSIKKSVKNIYIVGGVNAVSKSVEKSILSVLGKKSATRFAGDDRYETCIKINKTFAKTLTGKSVCIAKGYNFPDALAGGVFAAKQKAPLFLADDLDKKATLTSEQKSFLKSRNARRIYVLGGENAVPTALVKSIAKASV